MIYYVEAVFEYGSMLIADDLEANTLEELRELVDEFQVENCLDESKWITPKVFKNNSFIGTMSFDGRVWVKSQKEYIE